MNNLYRQTLPILLTYLPYSPITHLCKQPGILKDLDQKDQLKNSVLSFLWANRDEEKRAQKAAAHQRLVVEQAKSNQLYQKQQQSLVYKNYSWATNCVITYHHCVLL